MGSHDEFATSLVTLAVIERRGMGTLRSLQTRGGEGDLPIFSRIAALDPVVMFEGLENLAGALT